MHLPISILSKADPSMVKMEPFPHIVLIDALPLEYANNLTSSFPKHLFDLAPNNKRVDISAINVADSQDISQDWKLFIDYHSSKEFFKEVLKLFEHSLLDNKNINLATLNNLNTGKRFQDTFDEKDCLLDAQISINTPVVKKSSVRKAHTDNNNKIFSGSGYDIACADSISPIVYQLNKDQKTIDEVSFKPSFYEKIYFIYLNNKQSSISEIENYNKNRASDSIIKEISNITSTILQCNSIEEFNKLIESHELIISKLISKSTVKETLFKDFNGSIKSLGAWGGDMIMATSYDDPNKYFREKGYSTILKFDELLV